MKEDCQAVKKRKLEISSTETHEQNETPDSNNSNCTQVKLRIWRPTIPKYNINPVYFDDIVKTFVRKTGYNKNLKILDPVYADQVEFTQDINKLQILKPQFEAKHLRCIDMKLLNEASMRVKENEKLMYVYYEIKKLEKNEKSEKCLLLLKAYINNTRIYLDRIQELREFVNQFILEAEECWMFLTRLQKIANKR